MKTLIMIVLAVCSITANAQTLEEWFEQKETQRKYLLEQIAALKVYLDYGKEGYNIASNGLNTISDIKNGDFSIHNNYFESLLLVKPGIRNYTKVAGIINYQVKMVKDTKETLKGIKDTDTFTPDELNYCRKVFEKLLYTAIEILEELTILITSGALGNDGYQMKDGERIKRIDAMYSEMQDHYEFSCTFSEAIASLSAQRLREKHEVQFSKTLNALK